MMAPAQFECLETQDALAELGPLRLVGRIGLCARQLGKRHGFRERLEERTMTGALRRKKDDGGDLQRSRGELIVPSPQIHLELPDAASTADDRRSANRRGIAAFAEPA